MPKPLVLFVHGLGGDGTATWGAFPTLLAKDPKIGRFIDVAVYQYPTTPVRWFWQPKSIRIQDLAKSIKTELDVRHKDHPEIVLVCHSMGGIICQKYLIDEMKADRSTRIRALALYAVPNWGADLAKWGGLISSDHRHLKQLRRDSDLLDSIREDWPRFLNRKTADVTVVVAGQDAILFQVTENNSETKFVPDKGHINLVKPASRTDLAYLILTQLISKTLQFARTDAPSENTEPPPLKSETDSSPIASDTRPPALFDIYQPEYEPHYCVRREDGLISGCAAMQNIWLFGPSGLGKTAALMRALHRSGNAFRTISLGHYLGNDPKNVFFGLYDALNADQKPQNCFQWPSLVEATATKLEHVSSAGVKWILIEEMPLHGEDEFRDFFSHLCSLLMLYARRNPTRPLSLAFSSVNDPRVGFNDVHRMAELLKVIRIGEWRQSDIFALVNRILQSTRLVLSSTQAHDLFLAAKGSPRFVKVFFTNYLNIVKFSSTDEDTFSISLDATRLEIPSDG